MDNVPPFIAFVGPAAGASLRGRIHIEASASDESGVQRVDFFDDNHLIGSAGNPPYAIDWDSSSMNSGEHVLIAQAYDAANNVSRARLSVKLNYPDRAAFDPQLGVPRCSEVGPRCDTNTLLQGSGATEPHRPNTLERDRCAEDIPPHLPGEREAIERITITSLDGQPFAVGQPVKVDITLSGAFQADQVYLLHSSLPEVSPVSWESMLKDGPITLTDVAT